MMPQDLLTYLDSMQFSNFIFNNSSDVYWVLDNNKRTVFISPSIKQLIGYTPEEYLDLDFYCKFSETSAKRLESFFDNLDGLSEFKNLFIEYISKTGETVLTEVSGVILRDENSNIKGIYGLTVNISDKYKLQSELIAEKEKTSEAQKFKSIMLGIMGHEFRTPLSGILGFTKLLSTSSKTDDEKEILNYIYQSAQRLNSTLNSIVTLAAIESNQLDFKHEEINVMELIYNIYQSFEPIVKNKNISFDINLKNQNILIKYDENCLYQILYHLLDNAVKFTEKGRVFLDVQIGNNGIGDYVEFVVQDTGIGIKPNKFDTIFEPFRQLSEGHNRKFEGLGIGLTTTKKLVEKLNGSIKVQSKLNEGTIFTVRLPISENLLN